MTWMDPMSWTMFGPARGAVRRVLAGALAVAAPLVAIGSCRDATGVDDAGRPAEMVVLGGNEQQGRVGEELRDPLAVKVTDDRGRPIRRQLVNWRVTAGGGTVFAGSAITDLKGEARERWTLGTTAGEAQRVEVRAVDTRTGEALVFATFTATATAGAATAISTAGGSGQEAVAGSVLPEPIVVLVVDAFDNPVPDAVVTWAAANGGSVTPSSTTDALGQAGATWTLGTTAGPQTATASATGATDAMFMARALADLPAAIEVFAGDAQEAPVGQPLSAPVSVRVSDRFGNPTPNTQVDWSVTLGAGSVSPVFSMTADDGVASTQWTVGTVGDGNRLTASVGSLTTTFRATGLLGAGGHLVNAGTSPPEFARVYLDFAMRIQLVDGTGRGIPGVPVSWTPDVGYVEPAMSTTDAGGFASSTWLLSKQPGENTLTVSALDAPPLSFTVTAQTAEACDAWIEWGPMEPLPSGTVGSVLSRPAVAHAYDFLGNPVAGFSFGPGTPYPQDYGQRLVGGPLTTDATGRSAPAFLQLGNAPGEQGLMWISRGRRCTVDEVGRHYFYRFQTYVIMGYATPAAP